MRYKTNDYSVPVSFGHQEVWIRGYVGEVGIGCRGEIIALGPSGTAKTHVAIGLGMAACQKGLSVSFTTAAALVSEMIEGAMSAGFCASRSRWRLTSS